MSEFNPDLTPTGIARPQTPDGDPGHEPKGHEKMRLQYLTGQPMDGPQDSTRAVDPNIFEGLEELPRGLRAPKYAPPTHKGAYIEDE